MLMRKLLSNFSFTLLHLLIASAAARAAEPRPAWQVEWEKTMKGAETEDEVTVYVVDYPRLTVSQFQKAFPKIRLNQVDGPSGEQGNIKPISTLPDKGHMFQFYIPRRR